ncbi:MAG: pilus assembly protein PilP [Thermodesulfobacteriota bacterium]|nr:pilus assembly protein PilP [Thermodesulfobacteriota bacterium]
MYKHFMISSVVFLIGLSVLVAGLFSGCDGRSERPAKPEIVYKKIIAKSKDAAKAEKTVPVKSTPKVLTKHDLAKNPKADISPARDVKISKRPAVQPQKPKMTLEPKSDISKIKITKKEKRPVPSSTGSNKLPIKKDVLKPKPDTAKVVAKVSDKTAVAATKGSDKIISSSITDSAPSAYIARGKIDPFEPLFKETPVFRKKKKKRVPRTPLEKLSLGQLKLVAIIRAPSGNKALVEEISGKGYVIKKGTYIGLNSGKIIKIEKDNIIIEEEIQNIQGNIEVRQKKMKLQKPSGE